MPCLSASITRQSDFPPPAAPPKNASYSPLLMNSLCLGCGAQAFADTKGATKKSAVTANKDAAAVLEKEKAEANSPKDLVRGTVLSMIDEGYINKKENAILISVIGNNDKRTQKLEKIAVDAAVSTQKDSGIKLKVYKQHLRNQDTLKELANQYGISEGKAAFIQTIAGVIPEAQIDNLSTMSMSQLSSTVSEHLGDTGKAVEDVTPTEEPKESASPATPGASSTTPGSSNKPGTATAPQPEETVTLPPKPTPTQTTAPDPTPTR